MGSGIAKQIRNLYPHVYTIYKEDCDERGSLNLGGYSMALDIKSGYRVIFSIFGQDGYGRDKIYTNYDALKNGFCEAINGYRLCQNWSINDQMVIAIPYGIGCGLAGGDWSVVKGLLEEVEREKNVVFVAYKLT